MSAPPDTSAWLRDPGVLVQFDDRNRLPAAARADAYYMAGKIAQQIAAGNPCRQRELLAAGVGLGDATGNGKQMCLGAGRKNTVVNTWRHGLSWQ